VVDGGICFFKQVGVSTLRISLYMVSVCVYCIYIYNMYMYICEYIDLSNCLNEKIFERIQIFNVCFTNIK
jgi:hypothetical protein